MDKAKELEHERDEKSAEADELMHRHHRYAQAVALLQDWVRSDTLLLRREVAVSV